MNRYSYIAKLFSFDKKVLGMAEGSVSGVNEFDADQKAQLDVQGKFGETIPSGSHIEIEISISQ